VATDGYGSAHPHSMIKNSEHLVLPCDINGTEVLIMLALIGRLPVGQSYQPWVGGAKPLNIRLHGDPQPSQGP
jgi:hypothetical protein